MEGSWLSPHATLNENRNSSQKSENRGQSLVFLATGDFEQMSSNIARKELKCHTGLLKVGVHQNGAQELGIIVRQGIVILVVPELVRATRIGVLKSSA